VTDTNYSPDEIRLLDEFTALLTRAEMAGIDGKEQKP
jgi:hypothetical protein